MILRLLLLLLGAAAARPWAAGAERAVDLPCVVCHPSRDRQAFAVLSETPGVLVGHEAAQAFVCLSCHNGAVVDSRGVLGRGGQHPSGFVADRALPAPFPAYPGGRLECGTCHTPHGEGEGARRWLRGVREGAFPCGACHPGRAEGHLGRSLSPEQARAVAERRGRPEAGSRIGCATCHTLHGALGPKLLVAPYGADRDDLCRTCHPGVSVKGEVPGAPALPCARCHTPHGGTGPQQFAGGAEGPCRRCHGAAWEAGNHRTVSPWCADCHRVHGALGGAGGLLRAPGESEALCLPCHPDLAQGHRKPGAIPAERRALAADRGLALGPEGQVRCATCHRVHGAGEVPLLRLAPGLSCLYCHPEQAPFGPDGPKAGRHPVGVPLLGSQRHASTLARGNPAVLECSSCHRAHESARPDGAPCQECHPARAGGAGHGGVAGCGACHRIHGSRGAATTCEGCHPVTRLHPEPTALADGPFPALDPRGRSSAAGAMGCVTCHDPHEPAPPRLRGTGERPLCLGCHPDKAAGRGGPHLGADPEASCRRCHPPHGPPRPAAEDPAAAACRGCHGEAIRSFGAHTAQGPPAWKRVAGTLPLFDRAGARNPVGFVSCPTCHDPHAPSSLRAEVPGLCLRCHGEKRTLVGGPHDPGGSDAPGECTVCHPAHRRGEAPRQWELRADGRGTWNDRKCSPCHGPPDGGPVLRAGPTSHPVNRLLPAGMKPRGLPLFDALGGGAGRVVACATCHDLHGTPGPGGKPLPKFLRKDPASGELCTECHRGPAAVVGTPHDLRALVSGALGPCSPCHRPHGSTAAGGLWGLRPAPGEYRPNTLCRSCHRQGGAVETERPLLQHHMKDAEEFRTERGTIFLQRPLLLLDEVALRTGLEPVIPLYDRAGNAGPEGNLQCVSCHDPHQWSPMGAFLKPSFGLVAPNVPTSFLRLKDPAAARGSACATCHPKDAPARYQRYHEAWSDVGDRFR